MFSLSFQNQSTAVPDADLQAFIQDFQAQINNEFGQAWGVCATVDDGGNGWPITIVDYPGPNDPPGALGYHYLDPNFSPVGKIFAQLALDNGISWTTVANHEGLEILADPYIDSTVFVDTSNGNGTSGVLVYQEICDPCEGQSYAGALNGTALSDFVLPQYYLVGYPGLVDNLGQVAGPFQVASGGYLSYDEVQVAVGWQQIFGDKAVKAKMQPMARKTKQQPARKSIQYLTAPLLAQNENTQLKRLLAERDLELAAVREQLARSSGGKRGPHGNGMTPMAQRPAVGSGVIRDN